MVAGFEGEGRVRAVVLADGHRPGGRRGGRRHRRASDRALAESSGLTVEDGVVQRARRRPECARIVADRRLPRPLATSAAAIRTARNTGPARPSRPPSPPRPPARRRTRAGCARPTWSDLFDTRLQVAGWPGEADHVTIEEGSIQRAELRRALPARRGRVGASSRSTTAGRSRAGAGRSTAPRSPPRNTDRPTHDTDPEFPVMTTNSPSEA